MKNVSIYQLIFFVLSFFQIQSFAQKITFNAKYGGAHVEEAKSLILNSKGDYLVVGESKSFGNGDTDILILKIDIKGDTIWSKKYGGVGYEHVASVIEDADGNYVIGGHLSEILGGNVDLFILKLDSLGNFIWSKKVGGIGHEQARGIIQSSINEYILYGFTTSYGAGAATSFASGYVVSFDINGNFLWSKNYGDNEVDKINDVITTLDGGLLMTGSMESYGAGLTDIFLIKSNFQGDVEWFYTYGTSKPEEGIKLVQLSDSSYIIGGVSDSLLGRNDMFLSKISKKGEFEWAKVYGDNRDDELRFLDVYDDQYIYFGGFKNDSLGTDVDILVCKTDIFGDTIEVNHFGLDSANLQNRVKHAGHVDIANDMILHANGAITFAGGIESEFELEEFYVVRTDSNLNGECQDFDKRLKVLPIIFAADSDELSVDTGSIVFVSNIVEKNGPLKGEVICLKEVKDTIDVGRREELLSSVFIYPNPFSNVLTIENKRREVMEVVITNLLGKCIGHYAITKMTKNIDTRLFSSGVYIVTIRSVNTKEHFVKKLVKR